MKRLLLIVTLAAVLTGLNAVKPLHVDDATFYFNAAQIAAHPLDPYGYVMLRWNDAVPALHALAPPVLPYWWAIGIRIVGERPVLWKLWLFPFALIFVASLAALLRRFAPSVATPLLVFVVLSPVFLPSLNLMMDIPALALSLLALVLFMRACDRDSSALAVFAGLTVGLAAQTKYTAFLTPVIALVYARLERKLRLGFLTSVVAGATFAAWETALFFRYGESHFVYQIFKGDNGDQPKIILLGCLTPLLGSASPILALMALTVLAASRRLLLLAAQLVVLPFLLLLCPDALSDDDRMYQRANVLFAANGTLALLSMGWVAIRLVQATTHQSAAQARANGSPCLRCGLTERKPDSARRIARFLLIWLALELVGYVIISPFPAVRRIMGTSIAATLLIGYLADRSRLERWQRNVLYGLVAVTGLLGLSFFAVDYLEARAEQQAAYAASELIRREHPQARIWYAGYWGFQYYAEKSGMKQIVPIQESEDGPSALLPPSRFRQGDWLVIPDAGIPQQELNLDRPELEPEGQIAAGDTVPLSTLINFYASGVALRHNNGPPIVIRLYRVKDEFVAR